MKYTIVTGLDRGMKFSIPTADSTVRSEGILHIPDSRASLSRSGLHLPDPALSHGTQQQQHKE